MRKNQRKNRGRHLQPLSFRPNVCGNQCHTTPGPCTFSFAHTSLKSYHFPHTFSLQVALSSALQLQAGILNLRWPTPANSQDTEHLKSRTSGIDSVESRLCVFKDCRLACLVIGRLPSSPRTGHRLPPTLLLDEQNTPVCTWNGSRRLLYFTTCIEAAMSSNAAATVDY